MGKAKVPATRQERATKRAKAWGFSSDYKYRQFRKANNITAQGAKGDKQILESLSTPAQYNKIRKSGKLAQILSRDGVSKYTGKNSARRNITNKDLETYRKALQAREGSWSMGDLKTTKDYKQFILLIKSDLGGSKLDRARSLYYNIVVIGGGNNASFSSEYSDLLEDAGVSVDELADEFNDL